MARASTKTLLPLDRFAQIMGINPVHFNQVELPDMQHIAACGQPLMQYAWQTAAAVSREDIAIAIAAAEDVICRELGYRPIPTWVPGEVIRTTRPRVAELYKMWPVDIRGQWDTVTTDWGYVQEGGIEAKTLIQASAPIVYTDTDLDGYFETATITVATNVTERDEIAVYYPGHGGDDAWEIRYPHVTIAGGVATLVLHREQLVAETFMEGYLSTRAVNGFDNSKFLTTVDVYRHWHDPSTQVQFQWEGIPNLCGCGAGNCAACSYSIATGCLGVRSARVGLITTSPGIWNDATMQFDSTMSPFSCWRQPDRVKVWYRAGLKDYTKSLPNIQMDTAWEIVIARYAVTFLNRQICACQNVVAATDYWRNDLAQNISTTGQSTSYRTPALKFNNPLGSTRGALQAWEKVIREALGEGIVNA